MLSREEKNYLQKKKRKKDVRLIEFKLKEEEKKEMISTLDRLKIYLQKKKKRIILMNFL